MKLKDLLAKLADWNPETMVVVKDHNGHIHPFEIVVDVKQIRLEVR